MKLAPAVLSALVSNAEGFAPGLHSTSVCRDNHEMCPRWKGSCGLKQVYITCRKTCNKCQVPLVADFKPAPVEVPTPTNYRRPIVPSQKQPQNFFSNLFNSFKLPQVNQPVNPFFGRPQVVQQPQQQQPVVQPVQQPVQPVQRVPQDVINARTIARNQMPYEIAVLNGLADPFAVSGPGSRQEGVAYQKPLVLGPQKPLEPVAPRPAVREPVYEAIYRPGPVDAERPVVAAVVTTTKAPVTTSGTTTTKTTTTTTATTTTTTEPIAITTQAPTESPEASADGSGDSIEVTFEEVASLPVVQEEVAQLPVMEEQIPDAVIAEVIEPEMAARLMDAMCQDELVNCADAAVIDFCSALPGDANYEKFLPFQQGCRRTCGICDKNAACPDLAEHCSDPGVQSICAATCRGF